jgi:hypothetical protein
VDRIELHKRLLPDEDITITGNVTHVGKTSLEVVVEALKMNARHNPVIRASFSLVAKSPDPNARWTGKSTIPHHNIFYYVLLLHNFKSSFFLLNSFWLTKCLIHYYNLLIRHQL